MGACAVHGDGVHLYVVVWCLVAIKANAETAAEVEVDLAEYETTCAVEAEAEVGISCHSTEEDMC